MSRSVKPACLHPRLLPWFDRGETDFQRCADCGLVLRVPMPTAAQLDAIYAALYGGEQIRSGRTNQESGSFALEQYANHLVAHELKPGMRLLDYGCGSGALLEMLRQRGVDAIGLETSAGARAFCREQRGFDVHAALDEVAPASVDLITMIEVIEHLIDPHAVLEQVRTRLKPGGRLFVTTPNRRSLRARLDGGHWREATKKFHVVLFDDSSLARLLEATGFGPLRHLRYSPVQRPGAARWLFSRAQQALGLAGTLCFVAGNPG